MMGPRGTLGIYRDCEGIMEITGDYVGLILSISHLGLRA